jgi:hypothetical protein
VRLTALLVLHWLLLVGCRDATDSTNAASRMDSAGVTIVVSAAEDRPLSWTFERVADLAGSLELTSLYPHWVAADARGTVYLLDFSGQRVLAVDGLGASVRTVGRSGQGPGEYRMPSSLAVDSQRILYVANPATRMFVRFDSVGRALSSEPLPRRFAGGAFRPNGATVMLELRELDRATNSERTRLVLINSGDTTELRRLDQPLTMGVPYASCPGLVSPPAQLPLFAPDLRWGGRGDTAFVAASPQYVIDRFEGGRLAASWRRAIIPEKASMELAREELEGGTEWTWPGGRCRLDPEEELTVRGVAEYVPAMRDLVAAPEGSVWVRRGGVGEKPVRIDVLDHSGEYLGTLPAESPFPVAFLAADSILAIEMDQDDVPQLLLYRIRRAP